MHQTSLTPENPIQSKVWFVRVHNLTSTFEGLNADRMVGAIFEQNIEDLKIQTEETMGQSNGMYSISSP